MPHAKVTQPIKPCAICEKPMAWRRAWAKNWDTVRYCSNACQRLANRAKRRAPEAETSADAPPPKRGKTLATAKQPIRRKH